eukprot:RCo049074
MAVWPEVRLLLRLAAPPAATYLLFYAIQVITFMAVSRLGTLATAGIALGTMTVNLTGFAMVIGLLAGMDTLCAQAFGAENFARVGHITQRGVVVCVLWWSLISVVWVFAQPILVLLGQDPEVASLAARHARILITGLPALIGLEAVSRFLRIQNITQPFLWVTVASLPLHILWCWLLIFRLGLGFVGGPLALTLTFWAQLVLLLGYLAVRRPHRVETWPGWSREAFRGWREYFSFAIPGVMMQTMEWASFELMALIAGNLGTAELAAHSILVTLMPVGSYCYYGLGAAASVLVGQYLGQGLHERAILTVKCTLAIGFAIVAVVIGLSASLREILINFFAQDADVRRVLGAIFMFMWIFTPLDMTSLTCQGLIRGAGKQFYGTVGVIVGSYGVGLPLAWCLAMLTPMGLRGVWMAFCFGYTTMCSWFVLLLWRMNWAKASERAMALAAKGMAPCPHHITAPLGSPRRAPRVPTPQEEVPLESTETAGDLTKLVVVVEDQGQTGDRASQENVVISLTPSPDKGTPPPNPTV